MDSENSPLYLRAILVSLSISLGHQVQAAPPSHPGPVREDKFQPEDEGKAVIWAPLYTGNYHTSFLLTYLESLQHTSKISVDFGTANNKYEISLELLQITIWKKALFISTYFSISKLKQTVLVKRPKPHVNSTKSGAGIGPACLFTPNRAACTH